MIAAEPEPTQRLTQKQKRRSLEAAAPSGVGSVLDERYELRERIGLGGMGLVYRAHDGRLKRQVAVKQLHPDIATDPALRALFRREAEIMANLRHPNVVAVHDTGGWDSQPYLVMPFHEGAHLQQWAKARGGPPLPVDVAMAVLGQTLSGLRAMHDAGVVHGDVKPSNILISNALEVILVDLGLSRPMRMHHDSESLSGTPGYVAPEIIRHEELDPRLDHKTDIYSLGVTAYWLLTGVSPWGKAEPMDLLLRQIRDTPTAPSALRPDLPVSFDAPLLAALAVDPADRPNVDELHGLLLSATQQCCPRASRFIVIVDSDPESLHEQEQIARDTIQNAEVVGVHNAKAALAVVESRPPDLVITDLEMPEVNGIEFAASLRGNPMTTSVPIIVTTAVGGAEEWQLLHTLEVECLMMKPLRAGMLGDAIKRAVDR